MRLVVVSRETLYEAAAHEALLAQLREIQPMVSLHAYPVKSRGAAASVGVAKITCDIKNITSVPRSKKPRAQRERSFIYIQ
jgi:hypothetical protein